MDDEIAVVEQDPLALVGPLPADGLDSASLEQPVFDLVGDRLDLDVGSAGRDDEVVGNDQQFCHLDGDDVLGLLLGGRLSSDDCPLLR